MKKIYIPTPRLAYRLLIYIIMVVFAALSLACAILRPFHMAVEIVIYVMAAFALTVGIYYLQLGIRHGIKGKIKTKIEKNEYTNRLIKDYRTRTIWFMVPGMMSNILFAIVNGCIGILSKSAWFGSLSAYYILLSMMRYQAIRKERKIVGISDNRTKLLQEIAAYKNSSIMFIFMSIVLGGLVVLLETTTTAGKEYPGFMIYAVALYVFYRVVLSIINMFKVKKQNSPLLAIIRKIGYIDACVSLLILQTAMLTSFSSVEQVDFVRMMNGITGSVVSVMVLGIGIQGICYIKRYKKTELEKIE